MSAAPRGLAGPAALMFAGTATSRALGLVRNAVLALVLTVNVAGAANAFSVANKLPNVIYMLVAGGVLNAVLVPQIVRAMRQEDGGKEYVDRLLTMASAALAALTLVLTAASAVLVAVYGQRLAEWYPLAVAFAFWCIPQLFFYGLYTLLGQVLNARSSFGPYMWAPVVNNVVAIAGLSVFIVVFGTSATNDAGDPAAWTPARIALLAGTATAGVIAQAVVLLVPLYRSGFRWTLRWGWRGTGLGKASRVAMWAFAGLAVGQLGYIAVSNVAAAAGTAGGTSALVAGNAAYDNAFLVFMLPQSLITVSLVTALFTRMSSNAAAGDLDKVRGDLSFGLRTVGVFTVFATALLAVLALPVVRVVLPTVTYAEGRSVAFVTLTMLLGLTGLGAWTLVQRVYYAFEDTRSLFFVQIPMAVIVALGALGAALLLEPQWWVPGAGLAMSVSTWTGAVVAYLRLRARLGSVDARRVVATHLRLLAAAAPAALAGWGVLELLGIGAEEGAAVPVVIASSLVRVAVVGVVMLAVYLVLLRLLKVSELDVLARPVQRVVRAVTGRVRTMARGGRGSSAGRVGGGGTVNDAAAATLTDEGTVLARRYRLTEPFPVDLPEAAAWRGHDVVLDRPVNAVLLRGRTTAEALDAARRAALVDDVRLAKVLSVGTHEGEGFVVTDVVPGRDLDELVAAGPLPADQARAVIGEAASALEAARRRGVHHLALRPAAVHLGPDGRVVVTGLGFDAAQLGRESRDFWSASRADAIGLVSLLYLALTGVPPEPGPDGKVPPPADLRPDVPNDLDTLCVVTLGPHDDGPHSPAEVVRELAPWPEPTAEHPGSGDAPHHDDEDEPGDRSGPDGGHRVTRRWARRTEQVTVPTPSPASAAAEPAPAPDDERRDWAPSRVAEPDDARRPSFDAVLGLPASPPGPIRAFLATPRPRARHATAADAPAPSSSPASATSRLPEVGARLTSAAAHGTQVLGQASASTGRAVGAAAASTAHVVGRAAGATGHALGSAARTAGRAASAVDRVVDRTAESVRRVYVSTVQSRLDRRPGPSAHFDPTPYVLALMLGLVLFGFIWAVGVLDGDSGRRSSPAPATAVQEAPTTAPDGGEPPPEQAEGNI